jgi:O-antigen/teichoic acid export membrane protein
VRIGVKHMSRKKKALLNVFFSLILEVVTVISGFIVPRLVMRAFGSDTNGLINSITSFIGYIALLQTGVGAVIRAALYNPLAHDDKQTLSVIIKTTDNFFRKIGFITIGYLLILSVVFPLYIAKDFEPIYSISLVLIVGLSTFAQYFFGITYQMVLEADQKAYVYSITQITVVVLNTICVAILIKLGATIQIVKLVSSAFFVLRPVIIRTYVRSVYHVDKNVKEDKSYIKQRWDGMAQGLAYFFHSKTDIFVLTLFSNLRNVSIYSVYALVNTGLTSLITCIDKAIRPVLGNMIAKGETQNYKKTFNSYLTIMHIVTSICFSTASVCILSFVSIYTHGVSDANYIQPTFGFLLILAESLYCFRMPYNAVINVAGRFKETKIPSFVEAILNFSLSCILVFKYGLIGVAIGTLVAMAYRTIYFIYYLHHNILEFSYLSQIRRFATTFLSYSLSVLLLRLIHPVYDSYATWILYAVSICVLSSIITICVNLIIERKNTIGALKLIFYKK